MRSASRPLMLVALWASLACLLVSSQQIGLKTTLSEAGLTYAKNIGLQIVQQQLSTLSIPDITGDTGTPVGSISYQLTSIQLNQLSIPSASITIVPGVGLNIDVSGASAHIHLNWGYREDSWPHISDSGDADVSVSSVSISVSVAVGDKGGRPTVVTTACSVNIGGLSIDLHGGASWLYSLFTGLFSGQIQSAAQSGIQSGIVNAINQQAEQALSTIPVVVPIDSTSEVNFEMSTTPEFTATFLTTEHLGEFYWTAHPQECPYTAAAMPDTVASNMLQAFVSEYSINSAGFAYFQAGKLVATVHESDVPSWSPVQLNTTSFKVLIPGLYAKYPNAEMELVLQSTAPPLASLTSTGALISVPGEAVVNVILPNATVEAFTVSIVGQVGGNASVTADGRLVGDLWFINATMELKDSNIGPVDVQDLDSLINMMCELGVLPLLNQYAQHGFPLPVVDGVKFTNPSIFYGSQYLGVATDFTYTPSAAKRVRHIVVA